jgi:RNA polymerase sigma-70 factor (ECF subfamily)
MESPSHATLWASDLAQRTRRGYGRGPYFVCLPIWLSRHHEDDCMALAFGSRLRVVPRDSSPGAAPAADADLVESVRRGNAAAAAAFHDRLRPIVDRTLGRLVGRGDQDYDDMAQQALIELVLSLDRYRGDCPLDAWAAIVTARVVYHQIRRRRVERRLFVVDGAEPLDRAERTASSSVVARNLLRRIESHLKLIERKKAWAYLLHDVHGYDLEEISVITSSSRAAVQSRLVRGRKELHARIAHDPELAALLRQAAADEELS